MHQKKKKNAQSQCPSRWGNDAFDYEMCLPSAHYKSSDTGFLFVQSFACSSSEPTAPLAIQSDLTISLAGCHPRLEQPRTFLGGQKALITALVMDTLQIFPQQTVGFLRDGKRTWEDGFSKQVMKGPRTVLSEKNVLKNQFTRSSALECTHLVQLTLILLKTDSPTRS